jgi:hypothetical protein
MPPGFDFITRPAVRVGEAVTQLEAGIAKDNVSRL